MFVYIDRLKLPIIYNLFDQWLFKTCGSERERERERAANVYRCRSESAWDWVWIVQQLQLN